jgi:hypothetical protein
MPKAGSKPKHKKKSHKRNIKFQDKAEKYFNCTARERATFEAGIKLASVYHQFVGTPVSKANVVVLEKAISDGVLIQPFVEDVQVKIERKKLKNKHDEYDYDSLTGNMIDMKLKIRYRDTVVNARLEFIKDINYPLMYISSVK